MKRSEIRDLVRKKRNALTQKEQKLAAETIKLNLSQVVNGYKNAKIALYLSNDGELNTAKLIELIQKDNHEIYLPVLHPFKSGNLLFQKYEKNSPMKANRYGIFEPELNCSHVCPVSELDIIFTPLVAFDDSGNRLGMGGGFYDRTLAKFYRENWQKPQLIGIAHNCQKVDKLPIESWDVPLKTIITPEKLYRW
ncbi:5-formyltetrahydrofolate cyclo-ligase [Pseudoalteromonas denitrificans]|uniref:5-formyltetrahydrofolate cyclo-ligase n=1 Tax=Pseudoalteromonas denitrificans DSM 6059 TaxID=1123010 RepID=A0A1I1LRF6_9GAMM|nr:5-formyltetrahydrofolate cyclo-ligase [Pseudoalteromonas denitrificans]SFC75556.1 5-formyltetrahydrofolate cyclo-ligase [Pseudoalteromonas denitrificans DSM 6059]